MPRRFKNAAATLVCAAGVATAQAAFAHGVAGDRIFPATLLIDDPAVGDELSFPTLAYQPDGPTGNYNYGFEWDKTIIENFGFAFNDGYNNLRQPGKLGGNLYGWNNPVITLKYMSYVNED